MLRRLAQKIRDVFDRLWGRVEARYPDAAFAAAIAELRDVVTEARCRLREIATERARLDAEVREETTAVECLARGIDEALAQGDPEEAGDLALRLEELEPSLQEKRSRLDRCEKSYREALDRTMAAQDEYHRRAAELQARRTRSQAGAASAGAATAGTDLDEKLEAVDEMVRRLDAATAERSAAAAGVVQAAQDLARAEAAEAARKREERRTQGAAALARFAAARGGTAPAPNPPPVSIGRPAPTEKTIGPAS